MRHVLHIIGGSFVVVAGLGAIVVIALHVSQLSL